MLKLFEKFEKFESSENHEGRRTHSLTEDGPGARLNQDGHVRGTLSSMKKDFFRREHSVGGRTVAQRTEDVYL